MSRRRLNPSSSLFDDHYDPVNRIVYLCSDEEENEVTSRMAERAIKGLLTLDVQSSEKPITLIINTPGGCIDNGMAIYDAVKLCKSYVKAIVMGSAHSMGSLILQAADERIMAPSSNMLIHYGYSVFVGPPTSMPELYRDVKRFIKLMEDIYLAKIRKRHPCFGRKHIQEMLTRETIFTAKRAVALGLADTVAGYPTKGETNGQEKE